MSAQALKMKHNLEKIKKEREVFEEKKRQLDAEMTKGRINMGKIKKGLKNNEIVDSPMDVSGSPNETQNMQNTLPIAKQLLISKKSKAFLVADLSSKSNNGGNLTSRPLSGPPAGLGSLSQQQAAIAAVIIVPSGPRVSDWCFVGSIESDPPTVKSNSIYEIVRLLGRGAFGDVNLVKCIEDNRLFAMKTIFTEREIDMKDTLHEVRFLRQNRHPCIIDVHDGFMTSQPRMLFIVMPYCEGGDLDAVIKNTKKSKQNLSEEKILKWSVQIGLAMHFLHENGVVHRDLKPNNIMLTEGGDLIKLVDFGLALNMAEESINAPLEAGTPYYTAPEMIKNLKYSYPVDCWSFGVLLHEMLSLELPFTGTTTGDLVKSILSDSPPMIPSQYSTGMKHIANELLLKDMNTRMNMTTMLNHPLLAPRVAQFPQSYRPKAIEERIRRGHARQLTSQIESLNDSSSRKESLRSQLAISIAIDGEVDSPTQSTCSSSSTREELLNGLDDYTKGREKDRIPYVHTTHTAVVHTYSLPSSPASCDAVNTFHRADDVSQKITEDEELEDLGSRKRIEIKAAINAAEILSATLDSSSMEVIEEDEEES